MKNLVYLIAIFFSIVFSGCSSQYVDRVIPLEEGLYNVSVKTNLKVLKEEGSDAFNSYNIKKGLKLVSEFTLKENKTHFAIVNKDIVNNLSGFPVNTYKDLKEFCFKQNRNSSINNTCKDLHLTSPSFNFVMLNNPSYDVIAFDAKKVLEEMQNDK